MSPGERRDIQETPYLRGIRNEFDNLFNDFRKEFDEMVDTWWPTRLDPAKGPYGRAPRGVRLPVTDIEDAGDSYIVTADLPGFTKDEVNVKVTGDYIELSGQQEDSREETSPSYLLKERRRSSFSRRFRLPDEVLPKEAEAEMSDGVLKVKVTKKRPTKVEAHMVKIR